MTMELRHLRLLSFMVSFLIFQVFGHGESSTYPRRGDPNIRFVYFKLGTQDSHTVLRAGRALFGVDLTDKKPIEVRVKKVEPSTGCTDIDNADDLRGKIALVDRGACMFIEKARYIQRTGAVAAIVLDYDIGLSSERTRVFIMHYESDDDVTIPLVFLYYTEAQLLFDAYRQEPDIVVGIADVAPIAVSRTPSTTVESLQTTDAETVPITTNDSVGIIHAETGGATQLSPGYIALIVICALLVAAVSAGSCYFFCPSAGKIVYAKMRNPHI